MQSGIQLAVQRHLESPAALSAAVLVPCGAPNVKYSLLGAMLPGGNSFVLRHSTIVFLLDSYGTQLKSIFASVKSWKHTEVALSSIYVFEFYRK